MRAWVLVLALAGCTKTSEKYCMLHGADDPAHCPAPDAPGGGHCDDRTDCADTPATPACDTGSHACVACVMNDDCAGHTPVCSPQHTCEACTKNSDCPSDACLPDGACATEADVAYVDGDLGTGSACTKAMPCDTVTKALATPHKTIRVTGIVDETITIADRADGVILLGDATTVLTHNSGAVLTVAGTTNAILRDITIGGATPTNSIGVQLASGASGATDLEHCKVQNQNQGGIRAENGKLAVNRSVITNNGQGGIVLRSGVSAFTIRNNFIVGNGKLGAGASTQGGVLIEADASGHLEFNTVVLNVDQTTNGTRPGIQCTGPSNSAGSNLVAQNTEGLGGATDNNQIGGTCEYGSTVHVGDASTLHLANLTADPADPHLTQQTPATVRDAGGTCGPEAGPDIDGDSRPQGPACDLGADEFR